MLESEYIKGIDVSVCQGNIDWSWVSNQNIQFAIIRSGVGNDEACDIKCAQNIQGCKDNGILPAVYHFVYCLPDAEGHIRRDPISQSQWHFDNTPDQSLPVCIDLEFPAPQDFSKWQTNKDQVLSWIWLYLNNYQKLSGKVPILYSYPYYIEALQPIGQEFGVFPLWLASYTFATNNGQVVEPNIPQPFSNWTIWQNSGGSLMKLNSGIPVDTDLMKDLNLFGC